MDVLEVVLAVAVVLASFYAGGPLVVLIAVVALDFPPGSRQVASGFIDGGGWALLAVGCLAALGVGLYYRTRQRPELPALDTRVDP